VLNKKIASKDIEYYLVKSDTNLNQLLKDGDITKSEFTTIKQAKALSIKAKEEFMNRGIEIKSPQTTTNLVKSK
jgi:hypothetical protein